MLHAQKSKPRARDLGIPFDGSPAAYNAITDVPGVLVGYKTLIRDTAGKGVRTGVTVILPKGKNRCHLSRWLVLLKWGWRNDWHHGY